MTKLVLLDIPIGMGSYDLSNWSQKFFKTEAGKFILEHATVNPYLYEHYDLERKIICQQYVVDMKDTHATYYILKYGK